VGRAWRWIGVAILALCVVGPAAGAVSNGDGDLIVRFDGGISPTTLPRTTPAPVAVRVEGDVESASGDLEQLPQLREVTVAINRQGRLFDRGLPVCREDQIQSATEAVAKRNCGGAIVGRGHVDVQVRLGSQPPFPVHAKMLVFNGSRQNGHRIMLAQAYARKPPGSFILRFQVSKQGGTFGTVLRTVLPRATWGWASLTHFDMTLRRVYVYRNRPRSYISAACGAPPGLDGVLFPFAKATYGFADGRALDLSVARSCRVAGAFPQPAFDGPISVG
jgi:hypothetical protein